MDSDVQKILELAEAMKGPFKKLTARKMVTDSQYQAIRSTESTYNFFRDALSELQAAFDEEYKAKMERLTKMAKGSS